MKALAIPKSEIARLGLRHLDAGGITTTQRILFAQLKASGKANTLKAHATIAEKALVVGGLSKTEAKTIVKQALDQLTSWGIKAPIHIPWN